MTTRTETTTKILKDSLKQINKNVEVLNSCAKELEELANSYHDEAVKLDALARSLTR